jgi:3-hydroxyisobutyrate dehydrogenase-like beta-hydroxyacid dehydrogenase
MAVPDTAVLGLGLIGSIWARRYAGAGRLAASWSRRSGGEVPGRRGDPEEAARTARVLHLCLYDPPSVDSVLARILPVLGSGQLVLQSTTIDPGHAEDFAARVRETGAAYVEAPFTGSSPAAEAGKTVFYLGGHPEDREAAREALAPLGERHFPFATPREAAAIKLAMNVQIAGIVEAHAEGLVLARSAGIADDDFFAVLRENAAWSGVAALKEAKMRTGDLSPQFSAANMHKDLCLALEAAPGELPNLRTVCDRLAEWVRRGRGEEDFLAVLRLLEEGASGSPGEASVGNR